ncbi:hypothetical protein [Bacteroides bouchesdurhonensis]
MNIIISLLVFVLGLKGYIMLLEFKRLWISLRGILAKFDGSVYGKVVEVNFYTKEFSGKKIKLCEPKIEYKLEGKDETYCRNISATGIYYHNEKHGLVCGAKNFKVGDKAIVYYDSKNPDNLFVQPRRQLTRKFFTMFFPGCLYLAIAVGWVYLLISQLI